MKKIFLFLIASLTFLSCNKDLIESNTQEINDLKIKVAVLESQISGLQTEVSNLNTTNQQIQAQLNNSLELISNNEDEIESLNLSLVAANNTISSLQELIDLNQDEIKSLNLSLESANNTLANLQKLINTNQSGIESINLGLSTANNNILDLQELISTNQSGIESINLELIAANKTISSLQAVLVSLQSFTGNNAESIQYLNKKIVEINLELVSQINTLSNSSGINTQNILNILNELSLIGVDIEFIKNYISPPKDNISFLGNIKANRLLNGVKRLHFGNNSVPGVIETNCDWISIVSDKIYSNTVVLNPTNNTLLLSHGSILMNEKQNEVNNDNFLFFNNFFESPKKILVFIDRKESEASDFVTSLINQGHSIKYIESPSSLADMSLSSYPDFSLANLNTYQGIVYDSYSRPSQQIINNLEKFIENPSKRSVVFGLGWVWRDYRSEYENEPYPTNVILKNAGAKFIDWSVPNVTYDTALKMNYYPDSYSEDYACSIALSPDLVNCDIISNQNIFNYNYSDFKTIFNLNDILSFGDKTFEVQNFTNTVGIVSQWEEHIKGLYGISEGVSRITLLSTDLTKDGKRFEMDLWYNVNSGLFLYSSFTYGTGELMEQSCTDTRFFVRKIYYLDTVSSPNFNDSCQTTHYDCLEDLYQSSIVYSNSL